MTFTQQISMVLLFVGAQAHAEQRMEFLKDSACPKHVQAFIRSKLTGLCQQGTPPSLWLEAKEVVNSSTKPDRVVYSVTMAAFHKTDDHLFDWARIQIITHPSGNIRSTSLTRSATVCDERHAE